MKVQRNDIVVVAILTVLMAAVFVFVKATRPNQADKVDLAAVEMDLPDVIAEVKPAVVHVLKAGVCQGSGFLVSSDGIVCTAKHVTNGSWGDYKVTLDDGREFDVKYGYEDRENDLAFLQLSNVTEPLPFIEIPDEREVVLGESIIVIGSSLGIDNFNTVSIGIVSGINKNLYDRSGWEIYRRYDWHIMFQTNAAAFPGNSGGPVFDSQGRLLGVLVAGQGETLNFCVDIGFVSCQLDVIRMAFQLCRFEELEQSQPEVQQWQTYEEYAENVGVL